MIDVFDSSGRFDLERRLAELGDALALDDANPDRVIDGVLAELDASAAPPSRPWLRFAAAMLVVAVAVAVLLPGSRRTIAGWFGFDNATIERQPDLDVPDHAPDPEPVPGARDLSDADLPDGVVFSALDVTFDDALIVKSLSPDSSLVEVDVNGHRAIWIDGAPHELVVQDSDGAIITRRFAGNTLLWQVDDTLYRFEGFDEMKAALEAAATITP